MAQEAQPGLPAGREMPQVNPLTGEDDLPRLQSAFNYQATVRIRGRIDCLMRTVNGGFYWHTPNYDGMFSGGATREFSPSSFRQTLQARDVEIVQGSLPLALGVPKRSCPSDV